MENMFIIGLSGVSRPRGGHSPVVYQDNRWKVFASYGS
jgi:hypothetical protein